jgi:hypothetical protein
MPYNIGVFMLIIKGFIPPNLKPTAYVTVTIKGVEKQSQPPYTAVKRAISLDIPQI